MASSESACRCHGNGAELARLNEAGHGGRGGNQDVDLASKQVVQSRPGAFVGDMADVDSCHRLEQFRGDMGAATWPA